MKNIQLFCGDCLQLLKSVPDKSVDLIIGDLPYGTTRLEWDKQINLDSLWAELKRVRKENAAAVMFASQPFATDLINSNRKEFRYDLVWEKNIKVGFLNANKMPMRSHEPILVFYKKQPVFNPQKTHVGQKAKGERKRLPEKKGVYNARPGGCTYIDDGSRFPGSVVKFPNKFLGGNNASRNLHPTQKPLPLLEWLIKTYSNEGAIVLDCTMGSGSTGVAAVNCNRGFIGMELDKDYFQIAKLRIEVAERAIVERISAEEAPQ